MKRYTESCGRGDGESVQLAESEVTPPNTVLVRWKGELLLLDAWNVRGVSEGVIESVGIQN